MKSKKKSDSKMKIAKLSIENIIIRRHLVKQIYGVYVRGMVSSPNLIHKYRKEIWEEKRQEVLKNRMEADTGKIYPKIQGKISLKQELTEPPKTPGVSLCPYATLKDVPFDHGCQLWHNEFVSYRDKQNVQYSFFLMGKNNCKRLEECAIGLGKKLGMDAQVHYLHGDKKLNVKVLFDLAIEDIENLYPPW